jgi:hypothetical protein
MTGSFNKAFFGLSQRLVPTAEFMGNPSVWCVDILKTYRIFLPRAVQQEKTFDYGDGAPEPVAASIPGRRLLRRVGGSD